MSALSCIWFACIAIGLPQAVNAQFDPLAQEPLPPLEGTLFLHGGGVVDVEMKRRFIELAGGERAKIVVIPTADARDPLNEKKIALWQESPSVEIQRLHAESKAQAMDPALTAMLEVATGVWFSGGKQTRLIESYAGTPIETGIHQVLARGGVVGGTSAGAAVASKTMLVDDEILSGFDLLPGAIIDQHFLVKQRGERLQRAVHAHPERVGFGIDERTALIVRGRSLEVIGESKVMVYLAASADRPARVETLRPKSRADLIALRRAAYDRKSSPFPPQHPSPPVLSNGSLVIAGGGALSEHVIQSFIRLAGGDRSSIVYVPCSEQPVIDKEPEIVDRFRRAGGGYVTWLHTKDRSLAEDPVFLAPIAQATGIWFGGGRQWNLVDSYQNTEAHRLMQAVLDRGGVLGGSSAGASIQGDYMPRGSPLGNREMMAEGYERGLGFLTGVAIDQHFSQRNRFEDMAALKKTYPQLLGIGIDESTALIVRRNRAEIIGQGKVAFYDRSAGDPNVAAYSSLAADSVYDLVARRPVVE